MPGAMDDVADDVQAAMEEMVGAGDHHHRKVQRLGPGQDIGEAHGFVVGTVDHQVSGGTASVS
jgi:hypothetical protein